MDSPQLAIVPSVSARQVLRWRPADQMRGSLVSGDQVKEKAASRTSGNRHAAPPTAAASADTSSGPRRAGAADDEAPLQATQAAAISPRNLWQIPTIALSLILIGSGLYVAARPRASYDVEAAVVKVELLLSEGQLESTARCIRAEVEPFVATATPAVQARFHAVVADYHFLNGQAAGLGRNASDQIVTHYGAARELGAEISALRLERWAQALLTLGKLPAARDRLVELDRLCTDDGGEKNPEDVAAIAAVRNRVFRRVVEAALAQREQSFDELMTLLADYRLHPNVSPGDEIWAIARQTELRLMHGSTQSALDMLLIEMRRLESRDRTEDNALGASIGELYTLLGRCYFELGDYTKAETHLQRALGLFHGPEAERADALTLLGQIAMATGNLDAAQGYFQSVVADFITTRGYLPSLLGRAEVNSMLGAHESSMADYRAVRDELAKSRPRNDVTPLRVAERLCDRHDAALAQGNLERGLDFAELAESLFAAEQVPPSALLRLATINRQLADDLIAGGSRDDEDAAAAVVVRQPIDPGVRHEANVRYERAGNYFLRHASADLSAAAAKGGPDAASSIWLAADCFDQGGRQDLAIQYFMKYLDVQPFEDPRRAQTLFRMAQAHHAQLDFEKAIIIYEQLAAAQARTEYAAQSYVPLARCYVAVNRVPEARQMLQQVLGGNRLLLPDAADYRDALLELGRIEHRAMEYAVAIGALTEFLQRYAADPATLEVRYMLGDGYRSSAQAIRKRIDDDASILPAEVGRLNALCIEHLQHAEERFAQVGESPRQGKSAFEQDMIRRAALYRADCAFELQQFDRAVSLYDHASREYSGHQSSMYALIQIVNCYTAMGDAERAASAHHRALVRLRQLPDDAFAAPDGLMDRTAWERWLEQNPVAPARTAAAPTGG
jgi:tetratricopeptide (TPR) repeat protein